MRTGICLAIVYSIMCLPGIPGAGAHVWLTEQVAGNADVTYDCDLAIDSAGGLHVGLSTDYGDSDCVDYAHKGPGRDDWVIDSYDCVPIWFLGDYCAVALDSNGHFGAFYTYANDDTYVRVLKYAHFNGNEWHIEQVTPDDEFPLGSISLAYDSSDAPHVFYGEQHSSIWLRHEWFDGSTWQSEIVDSDDAEHVQALIDERDAIHLAYLRNNSHILSYGVHDGSGWQLTTVETNSSSQFQGFDIALDQDGLPHIAYRAGVWQLKHAWFDGECWHSETIHDDALGYPSMAIDEAGTIHICYSIFTEMYDRPLTYSSNDGCGWTTEEVDHAIRCWETALELDPDGQPHIIYHDQGAAATKHAWPRNAALVDGSGAKAGKAAPVRLKPAYPNPAPGCATIEFSLPVAGTTDLQLLDATGRAIASQPLGHLAPGDHAIELESLPRGVIFYRLTAGAETATRKMVVR